MFTNCISPLLRQHTVKANLSLCFTHLFQSPFFHFAIYLYTSVAFWRVLTNCVALLWVEFGQRCNRELYRNCCLLTTKNIRL